MRRWVRRLVWGIVVVGLAAAIVRAYAPRPVLVDTAAVVRGRLRVTVEEDGKTRVRDRWIVTAPLTGRLAPVTLRPGDAVKRGGTLAMLQPLPSPLLDAQARRAAEERVAAANAARLRAKSNVVRAQAALERARSERRRVVRLHERAAVSQQELEVAKLDARLRISELRSARFASNLAKHELEVARAAVVRTAKGTPDALVVTSPVDATVLRVFNEGDTAMTLGSRILELGDLSSLEVVVDVLSPDAVRIRPGMSAILRQWGGRDSAARVRIVEPAAFRHVSALGIEEQRVNIVMDLLEPGPPGDGYAVDATIILDVREQVLLVPATAVFRDGEGWAAFVLDEGRARRRAVVVGAEGTDLVEIVEGLGEGERVIIHPGDAVVEGARVASR